MRRLALFAAVVATALAPSGAGAAWTETATYDVPGGRIADCLRAVRQPTVAQVAGHARTHFAATLHVPHRRQAMRVGLMMRGADLRFPDQVVVRVR